MHIVVCLKQVPRDNSLKIQGDLSLSADGIEKIINLFDEYAIEAALQLAEEHSGRVTVLSIGSAEWAEQQRRALAMGADEARLLIDPAFAQLDSLGAARVIAAAVRKLAPVDLVIAGRNSTDEESGTLVPALARTLGWPQATYVSKLLELQPSSALRVERSLEQEVETLHVALPAVISVNKDLNEPRYPSLLKIKKAARVEPPVWNAADLGLSAAELAPAAVLSGRVPPPPRPAAEVISGADTAEKVRKLVDRLAELQLL
jgi:electron transfer flavoprotein beta subunit